MSGNRKPVVLTNPETLEAYLVASPTPHAFHRKETALKALNRLDPSAGAFVVPLWEDGSLSDEERERHLWVRPGVVSAYETLDKYVPNGVYDDILCNEYGY